MATLDTTRLIQPALTPAPTTTIQPKPAEGFQRLLDDETHKVTNSVPQPKAAASASRPGRETLQPSAKRPNETQARSEQDSTNARPALKSEAGSAGARSEAPTKVTQRKTAPRDSKPEATDGSVELAAESAPRQDLPSEETQEVSDSSASIAKEDADQIVVSQEPAPVAQTASAAALLASLLVQTTGDLKGTQVTVEVEPEVAGLPIAAGLPAPTGIVQAGPPASGTAAWMSSATPISPEVVEATPLAGENPVLPANPGTVSNEAPTTGLAQALSLTSETTTPVQELPAGLSTSEPATPERETMTAQTEVVSENAVQAVYSQTESVATAAKPAASEKQQTAGKSKRELTAQEELPELEVRPKLVTSQSISQPGTETAGGHTSQKENSSPKQQDAKPDGFEIIQNLKSMVIPNKDTRGVQPVVRGIQEPKENVAQQFAELVVSPEKLGTTTPASHETAFGAVLESESASSGVSVLQPAGPAGIAEPTGKVAGMSHASVNWNQVEKAQVVSQIVERAHLLGKNQSELMVVLKPEFLGKVNLHAAMVDNQLVATITAESASVKQMLESQLSSLQNALHDQGLPVAKVEVVQGSQLSFSDLGTGQSSSQQHLESEKSQLPPTLSRYETREEAAEAVPQEARIYAPPTSRSLNLVA
jgi:flagellar hook-length control protein FliK